MSEVVPKRLTPAGFALELLHGRNVGQRDYVVDEQRQVRRDHYRIGARQPRGHERGGGRNDEIQFSGQQRLDHDGARADGDHFRIETVLFEKAFLIGDPDRCVRRSAARPGDTHSFLGCQQLRRGKANRDECKV